MPILLWLCTVCAASWSITEALAAGDLVALTHLQLRVLAPVCPGETNRTEMWCDGDDVSFRTHIVERDQEVLNNGLVRLR